MELQEVEGRDMRDALERTRDTLGERAVVIGHNRSADGRIVLAVSKDVPSSVEALERLKAQASALLRARIKLQRTAAPLICQDVERRMRMAGCSEAFVDEVVEEIRAGQWHDRHPLDVAAEIIGGKFRVASARSEPKTTQVMAMVGPTGVGKTTTIAKLGSRLARAGRRVALTSLDRGPVASGLQAYAELLQLPCLDAESPHWHRLAAGYDVVLVDTSGALNQDIAGLRALAEPAAQAAAPRKLQVASYLVFSAAHNATVLEETARAAASLAPAGCVLTKLDEIPLPGPILEQVLDLDLPVAFISDGASYRARFHRAAPERFADLCLRGRLS